MGAQKMLKAPKKDTGLGKLALALQDCGVIAFGL